MSKSTKTQQFKLIVIQIYHSLCFRFGCLLAGMIWLEEEKIHQNQIEIIMNERSQMNANDHSLCSNDVG